jgi:ribosomal protein L11 methyltransferase
VLAPGGVAVLAGLIDRQAPYVLAAHRAQRLSLVKRGSLDGWCTLILRRRMWCGSDAAAEENST